VARARQLVVLYAHWQGSGALTPSTIVGSERHVIDAPIPESTALRT